MIEIDGSYGEGGGQVLRTSLSLSAFTGEPLKIRNIRANRSQPGLRAQHLAAVRAVAKITQAELVGDELNSPEVQLYPKKLSGGRYQFDIPTAGALTLVLQTIFLPLSIADSPSTVTLTGGSHVRWSPIWDYIKESWLPFMREIGFRGEIELKQAGFYPRGGGKTVVKILPMQKMYPFNCVDRGELVRIRGISGTANLDPSIATRQKHQALRRVYNFCRDSKIRTVDLASPGKGTFILLKAAFSQCGYACFSALGAPGKPAESVADEAVEELTAFLQTEGCVDRYMADQILLPLSIISGKSSYRTNRITQHLLTNIHVIEQFLPVKITLEGVVDTTGLVIIHGTSL